jgi:hypothetical protein
MILDAGIERIFGSHYSMGNYARSRDGTTYGWGRDAKKQFGFVGKVMKPTKLDALSKLSILDIYIMLDTPVIHVGYTSKSDYRVRFIPQFADVFVQTWR